MNLKCPTCQKRGDWFAGKYGPFCCHRCKLVDLGKWFSEEHLISAPLSTEAQEGDSVDKAEPDGENPADFP